MHTRGCRSGPSWGGGGKGGAGQRGRTFAVDPRRTRPRGLPAVRDPERPAATDRAPCHAPAPAPTPVMQASHSDRQRHGAEALIAGLGCTHPDSTRRCAHTHAAPPRAGVMVRLCNAGRSGHDALPAVLFPAGLLSYSAATRAMRAQPSLMPGPMLQPRLPQQALRRGATRPPKPLPLHPRSVPPLAQNFNPSLNLFSTRDLHAHPHLQLPTRGDHS
jgi:hypothetical protein